MIALLSLDSAAIGLLAGLALPRLRDRMVVALACGLADLIGTALCGTPGAPAVGSLMVAIGMTLILLASTSRWRDQPVLLWLGIAVLSGLDNLLWADDGSALTASLASFGGAWVAMIAARWLMFGGALLAMRALSMVVG